MKLHSEQPREAKGRPLQSEFGIHLSAPCETIWRLLPVTKKTNKSPVKLYWATIGHWKGTGTKAELLAFHPRVSEAQELIVRQDSSRSI